MVKQGIFTGGVQIRNLNGYLIAINGEVFATTNTGGTTNAFFYQAKTNITSGDPGSGHLIWNNATQTSATQLNVSHFTDTPIEDIDLFLSAIVSGNKLVVQDRNDSGSYQSWTVSGAPTQIGSSYWTIPVTLLESQGTGTTGFSNNHDLLFAIITGGTGGGGITTNSITFNNSGSGAASGTSFNGGTAVTISYNSIGAQPSSSVLSGLASLTYASGTPFVKMTGAGTFALDTNTYLTANQTITLSGDISGSGTTAITTTIGANKVTNAMLAQIATARIRGRVSAGTGNVEDLTGTQATTLLDTFTTTLKGLAPASGGGTTNFLRADGTWAAPSGGGTTTNALTINNSGSGAASGTTFNGSSAVTISYNTIGAQAASTNLTSLSGLSYVSASFVKMTAAGTFSLDTNTYLIANQTITLSGNVTGSGTTSIATTIANNVVTNAMLAQVSTATFHGRVTAGTGNIENLTGTQATTLLDVFSSTLKGLAPASGGGTTNFLRADGTWAAPSGGGGGTPAGSNTQIQYNNSGAFGASANLTYDGTSLSVIGSGVLAKFDGSTTNNAYIDFRTSGTAKWQLGNNYNSAANDFNLYNSATGVNSIVVNSSNQVGFNMQGGFLAANSAFEFHKTTSQFINRFFSWSSTGLGVTNESKSTRSNTYNSFSATLTNDTIYAFNVYGSSNSAFAYGGIFGYYQNGSTSTYVPGYWVVGASGGASADRTKMIIDGGNDIIQFFTSSTEKFRSSSSGALLINTTTDNGTDKLQVNGSMSVGSIKSSGNVGIFNSSPFYALSVGDGTSTRQVVINGLNSGTAGGSSIAVMANGLTTIMFGNKSNVTGGAYDGQPVFGFGGSTNSLQFYNFNTTVTSAMISSGDRFLIGTTTDNNTDRLQVNGSAIATALKITGGTNSQVLYADGSTKQITSGTAAPTGGSDGDIYLQYV